MRYNQTTEQPVTIREVSNQIFGTIRAIGDCENPELCLKDLCKSLGLDSRQVRKRLPDWVVTIHPIPDSLGRLRPTNFVTEPGIYKVIFESRRPEAEKFTSWVTSVVLPSIRKTGHYGVAKTDPAPVSLEDFKQSLVVSMQELVIKTVAETLKAYMPVVANTVKPATPAQEQSKGTTTLKQIAKELGTHSCVIVSLLVSLRMVTRHYGKVTPIRRFSDPSKYFVNLPYSAYYSDFIIVTEDCRQVILNAFPTYKKQHPYIH